jgi:hypothetical protein
MPTIFICPDRINYFAQPTVFNSGISDKDLVFSILFVYISLQCIGYHYLRGSLSSEWTHKIHNSFSAFIAKSQFDSENPEEQRECLILNQLNKRCVMEDRFVYLWENLYKRSKIKNELKIWLVK